jgi:hypothetical protein
VVLAVQTVRGLATGEPQRWAAKQARKKAIKAERRQRKRAALDGQPDAAIEAPPDGSPGAAIERRDGDRDQD